MQYEIGNPETHIHSATRIIGPFPDRDTALKELELHPGWFWARWGEITRSEGCTVEAPYTKKRFADVPVGTILYHHRQMFVKLSETEAWIGGSTVADLDMDREYEVIGVADMARLKAL